MLRSIAKQRESEQKQLQALIAEKKNQLERWLFTYFWCQYDNYLFAGELNLIFNCRLRVQQQALEKQEVEQNEFIDQFSTTW